MARIEPEIEIEPVDISDRRMPTRGLVAKNELQLERIEARRRLAELFLNSARVYARALDLALNPEYYLPSGELVYKIDPAEALELGIKAANAINKGLQVFIPATQSTALKVDMNKAIEGARIDARARLLLISGIDTTTAEQSTMSNVYTQVGKDTDLEASDQANAPDPLGTGTDRRTPPSAPNDALELQSEIKRLGLADSENLESNFRRLDYIDEGMRSEIESINSVDSIEHLGFPESGKIRKPGNSDNDISIGELDFDFSGFQKKIEFGNRKVSELKSGELISSESALDYSTPSFKRPKDFESGKGLEQKSNVPRETSEPKYKIDIDLGFLADIYSASKGNR